MKRRFQLALTLSFICYIGSFFGLQLIAKDKDFSELENRSLAQKPTFTIESLMNGKYGKEVETHISDQFPGRDQFIAMKSYSELMLQKKENNGVYVGEDGYFLQKFETPDQALLEKNMGYINDFGTGFNVYFMLAPTATKIYEEKLPTFATPYDEEAFIQSISNQLDENIHQVGVLEALRAHEDENLYYKTDHHWTTLGAYYAYEAFCKAYGIEPTPLENFQREIVSEDFYGSLFSKGNFSFATPDTVELFKPQTPENLEVYYMAEDRTADSLYDESFLEKKDKYSIFLGGNHPIIQIRTGIENGKKLVVVKDSYANAMIPFLTPHFEEIHVLDLRFLNMPIATYMRAEGIEDVLMLYNVQNFATVNQFSLLGQ